MPLLVRHSWSWAALAAFLIAGYHTTRVFASAQSITATLPAPEGEAATLRRLATASDSLSIWDAVELDPFRDDRTAAASRYRLPGAVADTERVVDEEVPVVTLLGTVVSSDGSGFALCQSGDEPPKLVRPGQSIGGLTLQRVDQAKATFVAADGRLTTLTVSRGEAP